MTDLSDRFKTALPSNPCLIIVETIDIQNRQLLKCNWIPFSSDERKFTNSVGIAEVVEGEYKGITFRATFDKTKEFNKFKVL